MPWDYLGRRLLGDGWNDKWDIDSKYPAYAQWAERIRARPVVNKVLTSMQQLQAAEAQAQAQE